MIPNVSSALMRFQETMQFQIVNKAIVDHDVSETVGAPVVLWFEGVVLPIPAQRLEIKPEGERAFKWWMLYTDLKLSTDDIIVDQGGLIYRIMTKEDWSAAGYWAYEIMEGVELNG